VETPLPNIPNELLQALSNEAHARFVAETGITSKRVTIDLAFIEPPSEQSMVVARVTDKLSGERRKYPIEVTLATHTVH
jgi:hypothetical protein